MGKGGGGGGGGREEPLPLALRADELLAPAELQARPTYSLWPNFLWPYLLCPTYLLSPYWLLTTDYSLRTTHPLLLTLRGALPALRCGDARGTGGFGLRRDQLRADRPAGRMAQDLPRRAPELARTPALARPTGH